jgi:hypothetical protein
LILKAGSLVLAKSCSGVLGSPSDVWFVVFFEVRMLSHRL